MISSKDAGEIRLANFTSFTISPYTNRFGETGETGGTGGTGEIGKTGEIDKIDELVKLIGNKIYNF